jgi:hypothetical protein
MLPDIRAVIAAVVTALVLLTISFGMVAAFRVAQDERAGSLHAELAQRGRSLLPISAAPRVILIVDTPAPAVPAPVVEAEVPAPAIVASVIPAANEAASESDAAPDVSASQANSAEVGPQVIAALAAPADDITALLEREIATLPVPQPPVGGPFAEPASAIQKNGPERSAAALKAARIAAARKVRAARLARQRRIAARRAALARRANANATVSFGWDAGQTNSFDAFNNGFANTVSGTRARPRAN